MSDPTPTSTGGRSGALSTLRLAELQALAAEMGIAGTGRMRKSDLVAAIREARGGARAAVDRAPKEQAPKEQAVKEQAPKEQAVKEQAPKEQAAKEQAPKEQAPRSQRRKDQGRPDRTQQTRGASDQPAGGQDVAGQDAGGQDAGGQDGGQRRNRRARSSGRQEQLELPESNRSGGESSRTPSLDDIRLPEGRRPDGQEEQNSPAQGSAGRDSQRSDRSDRSDRNDRNDAEDDRSGRRRRGRDRYRDRKRRGRGPEPVEEDVEVNEDDVLLPVGGILDVLDNYAFVRTSGYLPGSNDVYVSLGQVKKYGLRRGDAILGAVRQPQEGENNQRQKYNALVRLDQVNGVPLEEVGTRPDFSKLTPLYPQERLRLERDSKDLTTRIVDLVAPIGKGQRGLIVAPPKAGKTIVMQHIANAITANNPDVHLMVVLVDERPEEVTDMERTVSGEVIASTFDRPASDHTIVAELAIERAKRLVELGQDVVVLLDSLTRLSRAYNLAAPASGRILSGGVDASALYPPKKFFGAARNIEHGGSLTILASALVETGSKMDEVIFEEFKGTGNMELRLSRHLADKRIFPAVDVNMSGTRREELLASAEELAIIFKLRRLLGSLDQQQAIELIQSKLRSTASNAEFLLTVNKTTPTHD
ncbi:transcription termination factor Rho [Ruania suaedae]|uniref:transcription termination factor Rho n=1 Tax=Ruania suaedae TaxID=2897774 RepID=UPI001E329D93|nr:transcription termination factor Rho [Ruania suaedae]UFU02144.1 transcription termination factor Rho [Ruania suaedae]